ncbi:MAG: hypothetical protein K5756_03470 [Clostridiales bacterium]|nr:hypothetical protein [Clostridiales bacterium]
MNKSKSSLLIIISTIILVVMIAVPFIAVNDSEAITFKAPVGSFAEKYADQHKIPFVPVADSNDPDIKYDDTLIYEYLNGTITVTGCKTGGDVVIPSVIGEYKVTAVNINAIKYGVNSLQIPSSVVSINGTFKTARYTSSFYAAIVIILLAYVFAVVSSLVATKNIKNDENTFNSIPIIYGGFAALLIIGIWCNIAIFIRLSVAVQAIVSIIIFAAATAILFLRNAARDSIEATGSMVKAQTFFIKMLTADTQSLISEAKSDVARNSVNKLYETVRFSDPMSNDALANVDAHISVKFEDYANAVRSDDIDLITSLENELKILFAERNNKCKALK